MEDATPANGCLSFIPGSHKINQITHRLERVEGGGTEIKGIEEMKKVKNPEWDGEGMDWVAAPCEAGGESCQRVGLSEPEREADEPPVCTQISYSFTAV